MFSAAPIQSPYEASAQIEVPAEMIPVSPQSPVGQDTGLFGWISGNKIMSKVKVFYDDKKIIEGITRFSKGIHGSLLYLFLNMGAYPCSCAKFHMFLIHPKAVVSLAIFL